MSTKSLCVVAGEPSGDLQGSLLIAELKKHHPDWTIWGVGSDKMAAAGCDLWQDARDWGVIGFSGVLRSIGAFRKRLHDLTDEIERRKPTAVILIDYPGFNLRLAPRVKKLGIGVGYYIVPQLWAWGQKRIKVFRDHIDHAVVMFQFERSYFEERGVRVDWIGNPLIDLVKPSADREVLRERFGIAPGEKLVTMLPGARVQDFEMHLPIFSEAMAKLISSIPGIRPALGLAPVLASLRERFTASKTPMIVSSDVYDLVSASDLVITKTGTTTIECAILGTPMVTAYRLGFLNYVIARALVRIPYIAMPNIILNHPAVPELIQERAEAGQIASEATRLLTDERARAEQISCLAQVRTELGPSGAVGRAALSFAGWVEGITTPR